jgi:hypothetical protein
MERLQSDLRLDVSFSVNRKEKIGNREQRQPKRVGS